MINAWLKQITWFELCRTYFDENFDLYKCAIYLYCMHALHIACCMNLANEAQWRYQKEKRAKVKMQSLREYILNSLKLCLQMADKVKPWTVKTFCNAVLIDTYTYIYIYRCRYIRAQLILWAFKFQEIVQVKRSGGFVLKFDESLSLSFDLIKGRKRPCVLDTRMV